MHRIDISELYRMDKRLRYAQYCLRIIAVFLFLPLIYILFAMIGGWQPIAIIIVISIFAWLIRQRKLRRNE